MPFAMAMVAAMALMAGCQQQSASGSQAMTAASWQAQLDANLVKGTPSSDVEAYLAEQGITHSRLIDNAALAHMGFDPDTYEIKALVKAGGKPALVTTDTSITFVFDRERKLIETRVDEVHTGL